MSYLFPGEELDYLKMRIDGVGEAAARARWVFAWTTITCFVQLVALWNFNLSWLRTFVENESIRTAYRHQNPVIVQTLANQWVESLFFNVPIIGVKASVADLGLLGAAALTLLATWILYALKRENYLIEDVLTETSVKLTHCKSYVYFGIMGHQLFGSIAPWGERRSFGEVINEPTNFLDAEATTAIRKSERNRDRSRIGLARLLLADINKPLLAKLVLAMKSPFQRSILANGRSSTKVPRRVLIDLLGSSLTFILFMLPSLTVALAFASDVWSLYMPSVFRPDQTSLLELLQFKQYGPRLIANAIFVLVLLRLTLSAYRYQTGTVEMLQDAYDQGWDLLREGSVRSR